MYIIILVVLYILVWNCGTLPCITSFITAFSRNILWYMRLSIRYQDIVFHSTVVFKCWYCYISICLLAWRLGYNFGGLLQIWLILSFILLNDVFMLSIIFLIYNWKLSLTSTTKSPIALAVRFLKAVLRTRWKIFGRIF